jgi:hypothetical protein
LTGVLWYRHGFFNMSSNTPAPRGAARGSRRAGSTARASSPSSSRPCSRASRCGFFPFLPRLCFCWRSFGLAALRGRVHALAFLPVEDRPHRFFARSEAGGDVEQLVRVDGRAASEFARGPGRWCPRGRSAQFSDWATLGSSVQLLEKCRMKSRSDSPGFWVHARRSQELPGRTYVPWKFPTRVRTISSQLWIWLAGKCSSHVRAELVRCRGRLRMMTSSVVAPPGWHARR